MISVRFMKNDEQALNATNILEKEINKFTVNFKI